MSVSLTCEQVFASLLTTVKNVVQSTKYWCCEGGVSASAEVEAESHRTTVASDHSNHRQPAQWQTSGSETTRTYCCSPLTSAEDTHIQSLVQRYLETNKGRVYSEARQKHPV